MQVSPQSCQCPPNMAAGSPRAVSWEQAGSTYWLGPSLQGSAIAVIYATGLLSSLQASLWTQSTLRKEELGSTFWREEYQRIFGHFLKSFLCPDRLQIEHVCTHWCRCPSWGVRDIRAIQLLLPFPLKEKSFLSQLKTHTHTQLNLLYFPTAIGGLS